MAFKNDGVLVQEFEYDFAVDGGATGVISLSSKANKSLMPDGCIVESALVKVVTSVTGTGASAKIGHTTTDDVYLALRDVDGAGALGLASAQLGTYSTPFIADSAGERNVIMTISGGAITAGKLKVLVKYVNPNA